MPFSGRVPGFPTTPGLAAKRRTYLPGGNAAPLLRNAA